MATRSSWVQKIRDYAKSKNVTLLESHVNELGRMYDNDKDVDAAYNLLRERSGFKLESTDYRKLKETLR